MVDFAGESAAPECSDHRFAASRNTHDLDAAAKDDKDAVVHVPLVENDVARLYLPLFAKRRQPRNLRIVKQWKHRVGLFGRFRHRFFQSSYSSITCGAANPGCSRLSG